MARKRECFHHDRGRHSHAGKLVEAPGAKDMPSFLRTSKVIERPTYYCEACLSDGRLRASGASFRRGGITRRKLAKAEN